MPHLTAADLPLQAAMPISLNRTILSRIWRSECAAANCQMPFQLTWPTFVTGRQLRCQARLRSQVQITQTHVQLRHLK
jgi:hypothetical protein